MMQQGAHNIAASSRRNPIGIATIPLFSYGFRPFFLGAALWAIVALALFIGTLMGAWELAPGYGALAWHGHEMLFGFALAVIAGFLLTAVRNWTGQPTVEGAPLAALAALWVAGRVLVLTPFAVAAANRLASR